MPFLASARSRLSRRQGVKRGRFPRESRFRAGRDTRGHTRPSGTPRGGRCTSMIVGVRNIMKRRLVPGRACPPMLSRPGMPMENLDIRRLSWCRSRIPSIDSSSVTRASPESRWPIRGPAMRSWPVRPRRIRRPAWRRGLLAWLVLAIGVAPPPVLFAPPAGFASPADPADREASSEEDDAKEGAIPDASSPIRERTRPLRGPGIGRVPGRVPRRPAAGRAQVRLARHRRGGGHFLGEARHLRRWIQSFLF